MRHIVYIPGLGDHFDPLRRLVLCTWRRRDTRVTFVPMRWNDQDETYEAKYERIASATAQIKGEEIILVGESAGGAMALFAFARNLDHVHRLVTICGYNHGAANVHPSHRRKHPAFYHLMPVVDEVASSLSPQARRCITTIYSTRDTVVKPQYSSIEGASNLVLHTPGHLTSIARTLLRGIAFILSAE